MSSFTVTRSRPGSWVASALLLAVAMAPSALHAQSVLPDTVHLPAAAFTPVSGSDHCVIATEVSPTTGSTCCVLAPVALPDGATVTQLYMAFVDEDASTDFDVVLWRKWSSRTSVPEAMATLSSSSSSESIRTYSTTLVSNAVVDTSKYEYFVSTQSCLHSLQHLFLVNVSFRP